MQEWLRSKLDHITREFLAGGGYGGVFEAQYLAYLECLVASVSGPQAAPRVWDGWHEVCAQATPEGEQPCCLSNRVESREELVKALQQFRLRFEGPRRRIFRVPTKTKKAPAELDLFDLLNGDSK